MRSARAALLVVVAAAACQKAKPPPKPYDELVAKFTTIAPALTALGTELQQATGDCKGAARALEVFADKHGPQLDALMPLAAKLSPADQERFVAEMAAKFQETDRIFRAVSMQCPGDPAILAALQKAGFAPRRPPPGATP